MSIHIGSVIKEELIKQEITVSAFAKKINRSRNVIYDIFKRSSIDTTLLSKIGLILKKDLFSLYSDQKEYKKEGINTVMTSAELYNRFTENSIYNNAGLGIDLFPAGPTLNDIGDADTGPNDFMNFPVFQNVNLNSLSGITTISGTIDYTVFSGANGIKIELFKSDNDASGYGQGKEFIGSALANASGNWTFNCACLAGTDIITATATDQLGNTSEFSLNSSITVGINNISRNENVLVYPNPANSKVEIEFPDSNFQNAEYKIVNLLGELLQTGYLKEMKNTISINTLPQGIYYLQLNSNNYSSIKKIVKH